MERSIEYHASAVLKRNHYWLTGVGVPLGCSEKNFPLCLVYNRPAAQIKLNFYLSACNLQELLINDIGEYFAAASSITK